MNPLDWLLAILLTYSVVRAVWRGFIREAFALGGLVVGFLAACWFYAVAAHHLAGLITSPPLAQLIGFLLILVTAMIVGTLLGKLLQKTASAVGLGLVDRLLGGAFGLVRGAVLGLALLLCCTTFLPAGHWIQSSKLAPYFLRADHAVSFVMPADLKRRLGESLERLKHTSPDWIKHGLLSHTESIKLNVNEGSLSD
jgi:membrane protein required for colicin V production